MGNIVASWDTKQCVLCLEKGEVCEEHLIPRFLGGKLTCKFLCRSCNSRLGHDVDASAKFDPAILFAVQQLKKDIPELAQQITEAYPHVTVGGGPSVSGYIRNGEFRVNGKQLEDGTLALPLDKTPYAIAKWLKKDGYDEKQIQDALEALQKLPENQKTTIAPGLKIINWSVQEIKPDPSKGALLDPLLPAKIAFEFLALCAGTAIYANERQLSHLRHIVMGEQKPDNKILRVERLTSKKFQTFHGIVIEDNSKYFQVQIRLFGLLAFRVHFLGLHLDGPRFAYTHCLKTGEEEMRKIENKHTSTN